VEEPLELDAVDVAAKSPLWRSVNDSSNTPPGSMILISPT